MNKYKIGNKSLKELVSSRFFLYLIFLLLLLPSFIWICTDKTVWPWDPAWYGEVSINLFSTMKASPLMWIPEMIKAFEVKAPGIAWLGQFFVPIGNSIGSIDIGLMLLIIITQWLVLVLIFESVRELTKGKTIVAFIASLLAASSPLFIGLSHYYFVEPLQTLAVAWFIFIMSFAPKWQSHVILLQLVYASCFAMLTKVTSPAYCLIPGLIALRYVRIASLLPKQNNFTKHFLKFKWRNFSILTFSIIVIGMTLGWYLKNLSKVVEFAISSSKGVEYGKKAPFLIKMMYWLGEMQKSFLLPAILVFASLFFVTAIYYFLRKGNKSLTYFDICAIFSLVNILIVLTICSLSANEEVRYLLPLTPHLAICFSWIIMQIDKKVITYLAIIILLIQFSMVQAMSLNLIPLSSEVTRWLIPLEKNDHQFKTVESIVDLSCTEKTFNKHISVGVELPWLNANSLAYFTSKKLNNDTNRCYYTSLGYAETDVQKAWKRIEQLKIQYFITLKTDLQSAQPDFLNKVNLAILEKVEKSSQFNLDSTLDEGNILIFKNRQNN